MIIFKCLFYKIEWLNIMLQDLDIFFFIIQDEIGSSGLVVGVSINGKIVWVEGIFKFNGVKLYLKFIQRIIYIVK